MPVYVDSSALIKRSVVEPESEALEEVLARFNAGGDVLASSSLAWVEVSHGLRGRLDGQAHHVVNEAIEDAMAGIAERPINDEVISLARRVGPNVLRILDAIHLATAILLDASVVLCYDTRLASACQQSGLIVVAPGR